MTGFAVLDLETTGIHTGYHHRMVEVAVVQLDDQLEVESVWCTLLDPRRDLGDSTSIHGLHASDLSGAPTFEEIAGDLFDAVAGRRLVVHNASFDLGFFAYETQRAELPVTWPGAICTLMLGSALGLPTRLGDLAAAVGVHHARANSAADDAGATAALFAALGPRFTGGVPAIASGVSEFSTSGWPSGSGKTWARTQSRQPRTNTTFMTRLASRVGYLPGGGRSSGNERTLSYADLLDRALEDRVLTETEIDELLQVADAWELTTEDINDIHLGYLTHLVGAVLADEACTDDELLDLQRVCDLLGLARDQLNSLLEVPAGMIPPSAASADRAHELRGMSVCFTGPVSPPWTVSASPAPQQRCLLRRQALSSRLESRSSSTSWWWRTQIRCPARRRRRATTAPESSLNESFGPRSAYTSTSGELPC